MFGEKQILKLPHKKVGTSSTCRFMGLGCTSSRPDEILFILKSIAVQKVAHGQVFFPPVSRPGMADKYIHILDLTQNLPADSELQHQEQG